MSLKKYLFFIGTFIFFNVNHTLYACTDFRVTAKDGTIVVGRSLEFAMDLKSNVRTSPRGRQFNTSAPSGQPGISWQAKYGYVFLDGLNVDMAMDGMNEVGLSFEALYLPSYAQYQAVPAGQESHALPYMNVGDWILSNFQSIDEVRKVLPTVFVYEQKIPGLGDTVFPLHFAVYDATGQGIVVEYVQGKLTIYDNKIGVMTNSPSYDWHLTNLENYLHLAPVNPQPVIANGVTFAVTGQGFGMIGLPGDISPPSRFVKMSVLKRVALPVDTGMEAVNLVEHLINNVDIVKGEARESEHGNYTTELTQWVVLKDLTHKVFYYRTYNNMTLRAISLNKIDFSKDAPRLKMPMDNGPFVMDMTTQFLNQKSV